MQQPVYQGFWTDGKFSSIIGVLCISSLVLGWWLITHQTQSDYMGLEDFRDEVRREFFYLVFGVLVFNFFGLMTSVKSLVQGTDRGYGLIGFLTNLLLFVVLTIVVIRATIWVL